MIRRDWCLTGRKSVRFGVALVAQRLEFNFGAWPREHLHRLNFPIAPTLEGRGLELARSVPRRPPRAEHQRVRSGKHRLPVRGHQL